MRRRNPMRCLCGWISFTWLAAKRSWPIPRTQATLPVAANSLAQYPSCLTPGMLRLLPDHHTASDPRNEAHPAGTRNPACRNPKQSLRARAQSDRTVLVLVIVALCIARCARGATHFRCNLALSYRAMPEPGARQMSRGTCLV